ncbi:MAG: hypothetical protein LAP13_03630 [Acidobacteriia bacterium]|nr:hypothetical protein [Terriglobia bacterium]
MSRPCSILTACVRRSKPLLTLAALLAIMPGNIAWGKEASWLLDASSIGISVGAKAPAFELRDQVHRMRKPASLMGPRGLVLVFIRSADW